MSKTFDAPSSSSSSQKASPFDRLECIAHNCPLLLRAGRIYFTVPVDSSDTVDVVVIIIGFSSLYFQSNWATEIATFLRELCRLPYVSIFYIFTDTNV